MPDCRIHKSWPNKVRKGTLSGQFEQFVCNQLFIILLCVNYFKQVENNYLALNGGSPERS